VDTYEEDTYGADTCHIPEHQVADSSPWANRASCQLEAPEALNCDGLAVPGEDPDGANPDGANPGIVGSSQLVGLRQKEALG
jgi:hypothetical protein